MNHPKLTILTCTYNGARTLQQALEAIANQTDCQDLYEVLVVDNGSTDQTAEIARETLQRLKLKGRVLCEPKVGKIHAFLKGIYEAKGELISIIDDDNFIEPGFIHHTLKIFDKYPQVGMVGSINQIYSDQDLPTWFEWASSRYGCSPPKVYAYEKGKGSDGILIAKEGTIAGAGSTFRTQPLLDCLRLGYKFFNDTQRGKGMKVTGEDTELCWLLRCLGYQFAYSHSIRVRHAIKTERLTLEHFKLLCKTIGAGDLGIDPFRYSSKEAIGIFSYKWTWQWQLVSKLKRYVQLSFVLKELGDTEEERRFYNWIHKIECWGAIQRILQERENYTQHLRHVATGEWNQLRVR
jgi:glycosyltransferase involved in cell wall biosynthesis